MDSPYYSTAAFAFGNVGKHSAQNSKEFDLDALLAYPRSFDWSLDRKEDHQARTSDTYRSSPARALHISDSAHYSNRLEPPAPGCSCLYSAYF